MYRCEGAPIHSPVAQGAGVDWTAAGSGRGTFLAKLYAVNQAQAGEVGRGSPSGTFSLLSEFGVKLLCVR